MQILNEKAIFKQNKLIQKDSSVSSRLTAGQNAKNHFAKKPKKLLHKNFRGKYSSQIRTLKKFLKT